MPDISDLFDVMMATNREIAALAARVSALEGGTADPPQADADAGETGEPRWEGFLPWTSGLHDALPDGECSVAGFALALADRLAQIAEVFPEATDTITGMVSDLSRWAETAGDDGSPTLPARAIVAEVGRALEKEQAERGEHAGITRMEFLDAWQVAIGAHRGAFGRAFGNKGGLPFVTFGQLLAMVAYASGEALGAGENRVMGGADDTVPEGGWGWSMPGQ